MSHEGRREQPDSFEEALEDQTEKVGPGDSSEEKQEIAYADLPAHQLELKEKILKQDLSLLRNKDELVARVTDSLQRKGVVFLKSPTGTGKSIGSLVAGLDIVKQNGLPPFEIQMQPRKDAASNIARATSAVLDEKLGRAIGFSTSEAKEWGSETKALVVTSGIFVRYLMEGRIHKNTVGLLIVDEVHEGSLDYHLVFGLLKELIEKGDAPPIIFTSADFDVEGLKEYFGVGQEDVMELQEVMHPVEVSYAKEKDFFDKDGWAIHYLAQAAQEVEKELKNDGGDILVFLPGGGEINDVAERLGEIAGVEVLPLHGGLKPEERDQALSGKKGPGIKRRVILCTNIAETSLTVPGVTVVIDSCRHIVARYDEKLGIIKKEVVFISQKQAIQRQGRAGRVEPGKCMRLITKEQSDELREHSQTEIETMNLSSLILKLKKMGRDVEDFPFYQKPDHQKVVAARRELRLLGALDKDGNLTPLGQEMADTYFEPRLARMLIEAKKRGCAEVALLLSVLSREEKFFLGPSNTDVKNAPGYDKAAKLKYARQQVGEIQTKFEIGTDGSDWLKMLNAFVEAADLGVFRIIQARKPHKGDPPEVFERWDELKEERKDFEAWCRRNYVSAESVRHVAYRLFDFARQAGIPIVRGELREKMVHFDKNALSASLLAGYPDKLISNLPGSFNYSLFDALSYMVINIHPGSAAFEGSKKSRETERFSRGDERNDDFFDEFSSRGVRRRPEAELKLAFAGIIEQRKDGGSGRCFARMVHPVSPEVTRQILAEYVQREYQGYHFNRETGCVEAYVGYSLQGGSIELGSVNEEVQDEESTKIFVEAICNEEVVLSCHRENKDTLQKIWSYSLRVRKPFPIYELRTWYAEKLGTISSVREMRFIEDQLRIDINEYFSQEERQEIDRYCPTEIVLPNGEKTQVEYNRDIAYLNLSPEQAMSLPLDYAPQFGFPGKICSLFFQVGQSHSQSTIIENKIDVLQEKIEPKVLELKFTQWKNSLSRTQIEVSFDESLPPITPVEFTKNRKGESVFAYRVPNAVREYSFAGTRFSKSFEYVYYFREAEAKQAFAKAVQEKEERDMVLREQHAAQRAAEMAQQERQKERELARQAELALVPKAEDLFEQCSRHIARIKENPIEFGIHPRSLIEKQKNLRDFKVTIGGGNTEKAIVHIQDLLNYFETSEREIQKTRMLYEDVRVRANQLFQGIDDGAYILQRNEVSVLHDRWDRAKSFLGLENPIDFDPKKARSILLDLFYSLESFLDPAKKELREKLQTLMEKEGTMYTYKFVVENGKITNVFDWYEKNDIQDVENQKFRVPKSEQELKRENGNTLKFISHGEEIYQYTFEKDGTFVVGPCAEDVIEVRELDSGAMQVVSGLEKELLEGYLVEDEQLEKAYTLFDRIKILLDENRSLLGENETQWQRSDLKKTRMYFDGTSRLGGFDPVFAVEQLEKLQSEVQEKIERKQKEQERNLELLGELKKLWSLVRSLNQNGYYLRQSNLGAFGVKFPYLGLSRFEYEYALRNYEEVEKLMKNDSDALKNIESLNKKILSLYNTLKFCDLYVDENFGDYESSYDKAKREQRDARKQMNQMLMYLIPGEQVLELLVQDGKVTKAQPFGQKGADQVEPKEIPLSGSAGGKLKTNYAAGNVVFADAQGKDKFVFQLKDGTFLVSPDGYNVVEIERLPAGALNAKAIVDADTEALRYVARRIDVSELKSKFSGGAINETVSNSNVTRPEVRSYDQSFFRSRENDLTPELRENLQSRLEFVELILSTHVDATVLSKHEKEGLKIKKRAKTLREAVQKHMQTVQEAKSIGTLRKTIEDDFKAAQNIAKDWGELTGERENWPEVYNEMLGFVEDFEMEMSVELTPEQKKKLEPKLVALARDKKQTLLKRIVDDLVMEIVAE